MSRFRQAGPIIITQLSSMQDASLEILNCPLIDLNGLYHIGEGGIYKHSTGRFIITKYGSKWAVFSGSSAVCLSGEDTSDITLARWDYFSQKSNIYKKSKHMRVVNCQANEVKQCSLHPDTSEETVQPSHGSATTTSSNTEQQLATEPEAASPTQAPVESAPPTATEAQNTLSLLSNAHNTALSAGEKLTQVPIAESYVRRDITNRGSCSALPCGEEFRKEYETALAFAAFEGFAYDILNCLDDMGHHAEPLAIGVFVHQVMLPLHSVVQQHVEGLIRAKHAHMQALSGVAVWSDGQATVSTQDSEAKRFFFTTLQASLLAKMQYIDDSSVTALMSTMGPLVGTLHTAMAGSSSSSRELINKDLSIEKLVKLLLRLHTVAALSDPRCYLHPAPGVRLPYKEGLHQEILSPGAKRYGHIKEGDLVEVVLPGLYFDRPQGYGDPGPAVRSGASDGLSNCGHNDPVAPTLPHPPGDVSTTGTCASTKCRVPCLVRRLVGATASKDIVHVIE